MLLALASACSRPAPRPERIALLPFDNLTGDSSFDWLRSAAPDIVAGQLNGMKDLLAMRVGALRDAYADDATRFVQGYFDQRHGKLHFEVNIEDSSRHKMVGTGEFEGDLLPAMNALSKTIDPAAQQFSSANPEAVAAWGHGDYERAVSLDANFSGAWLSWVETRVGAGDSRQAVEIAGRALDRSSLSSPVDRAQ